MNTPVTSSKIALIHFSDIHFEDATDWIYGKAEIIARAAASSTFSDSVAAFLIIVSGDIANKGSQKQYDLASNFFQTIKDHLIKEFNVSVYFIMVPGNHDCDFGKTAGLKLRNVAIEGVLSNPELCSIGDEIYDQCLQVQQNFFKFVGKLEPTLAYPSKPQVFYRLNIQVESKNIVFNCFNTAWLTQIEETQGKLIMPEELIAGAEVPPSEGSLLISVFHHPENWLAPENSSQFRRLLRRVSDMVVTGHEHDRDIFNQRQIETGDQVQYHRAAALQERSKPETSNFNVILLDLDNAKQKLITFKWDEDKYNVNNHPEWVDFSRNNYLLRRRFELQQAFEKELRSLNGLPITHSRRKALEVEDLFITPRLQVYSYENIIDGKPAKETIERDNVIDFIIKTKTVVLYGETLQGKTTIAKYLHLKFLELDVIPVFLNGEDFTKFKTNLIDKTVENSFDKQYGSHLWDSYKQLDKANRMAIIDNFGQSGLNQVQLQNLLAHLSNSFGFIVAVAHSNLQLQQYVENENGEIKLSQFTHCELRPMNSRERTELVRKWVTLANDSISEDELLNKVRQHQQAIETAYDTGIISPFPAFLMGILQLSETSSLAVDQTQYGTIGYLYEGLITSRFYMLEEKNIDLPQIYILLGHMAHHCFKRDRLDISIDETNGIISRYQSEYLQNIYSPKFIEQVTAAGILSLRNGRLFFNTLQLRDFFVADYLSKTLGDEETLENTYSEIEHIIKTVTFESHTRVLLFLVYKANNKPKFIDQVVNISKFIYAPFKPADLDKDIEFLNTLQQDALQAKLTEGETVWERQDKLNEQIDKVDSDQKWPHYADKQKFVIEYNEELDEFTKAAITLKMIEVLGQLGRSFASNLKAKNKKSVISETIELGLRFLSAMYMIREEDIHEVREILSQLIRERHTDLNSTELIERADQLLLFSFFGLTYGVIKKISVSIGHEDLKGSFEDIFNSTRTSLSYRIMEAALRLDHYKDPLLDKVIDLGEEIKEKNVFVWTVLQRLVASHLNYGSALKGQERQRLMAKFNIHDNAALLVNEEKSERKYIPPQRQRFLPPVNDKSKKHQ